MRAADYYGDTTARSSDWVDSAWNEGFAPVGELMTAAEPFLRTGQRILDIGCQGGHQLAMVSHGFVEAIGIDIADYSQMWAQFPAVQFMIHDVDTESIPFPDGSFDTVLATNVLEHVFDVFGFVDEVARLLAPGGTALISVPNAGNFRRVIDLARGRVPRTGANERPFLRESGWDGQHLHYFTPKELRWLLDDAGLLVTRVLSVGRLPRLKRLSHRLLSSSIDVICTRR
jgi:SAM-dependent methyltransferase